MLIALGNEEELRHLNYQEDWLKTAVISVSQIFKQNGMPMALYIAWQFSCQCGFMHINIA